MRSQGWRRESSARIRTDNIVDDRPICYQPGPNALESNARAPPQPLGRPKRKRTGPSDVRPASISAPAAHHFQTRLTRNTLRLHTLPLPKRSHTTPQTDTARVSEPPVHLRSHVGNSSTTADEKLNIYCVLMVPSRSPPEQCGRAVKQRGQKYRF